MSAIAAVVRVKLEQNYRCLYLDHPAMIDELQCYLDAADIPIEREVGRRRLLLSADQRHLMGRYFDPERMLRTLETAYHRALDEGFEGLWTSGNMAWQMGSQMDCSRLLEFEQGLENFIAENARMGGICQYQVSTLSREAVHRGLLTHQSFFVSENLSMINPYFLQPPSSVRNAAHPLLLDAAVGRLCEL